jgi:hypothetical protein
VEAGIPNTVSIAFTKDHDFWAGGSSGLYRLKGRDYKHYKAQPGVDGKLQDNGIASINPDGNGNLWIATFGGGVSYFEVKSNRFSTFNQNLGLITSNTYDIVRHRKQVWVSHLKGVSILKADSSGFTNLTKANALPIAEMNRNPFFQSASGQMFLGGNGGWFTFHPDSLNFQINLQAPTILKWRINYKPISQKDKLLFFGENHSKNPKKAIIYPEHKNISFELFTMNTLWGDQIKYAFKLVGYNENWVEVDYKDRRITYTNLPVGNYLFQAKATNRFGIWSEKIQELAIGVRPSFTQTLGFKILMALSIVGLIAGLAYAF